MPETRGQVATGFQEPVPLLKIGDRLLIAARFAAAVDQSGDVAGWIGEHGNGEIAHIYLWNR